MIRILIALAIAASLTACAWEPVRDIRNAFSRAFHRNEAQPGPAQHGKAPHASARPAKGGPELAAGIRAYNNGQYAAAARELHSSLKLGLDKSGRVQAHKYLAFIDCASGHTDRCRQEFRLALKIDPHMQLTPAEAGHPIWGPVFRSVKAGR